MPRIQLNGQAVELPEKTDLQTLAFQQGLEGKRYAIELNEQIITRSLHVTTQLKDGDKVEIIHAVGGG
jgi:sulfur carrier protein